MALVEIAFHCCDARLVFGAGRSCRLCLAEFYADSTTKMRTLVDLLNDDRGYVRIYVDQGGGFGYERSTYSPVVIGDLFDRMSGYDCVNHALAAAQLQLQTPESPRRRKRRLR